MEAFRAFSWACRKPCGCSGAKATPRTGGVKAALVGADGQGGLKAGLGEALSDFVRVAKAAPEAEEAAGRGGEAAE